MNAKKLIFVGFELTDELSEQFVECSDRDKVYLDDPTYLEKIVIDDRKYIGKRAPDNIAIDRLEDIARSVVSLMARVSKNWTTGSNEALVIAADEDESNGKVVSPTEEPGRADGFDYTELVD
ncbi:MAG: hypothetical protein GY847_16630 [Proteobacteria bacterium]|nr:hypothetical protein [Pseudomonadota bacterium]